MYTRNMNAEFRRPRFSQQNSFTIIEILLVVSLLSVLSIAIFHTLVNGLKIWERAGRLLPQDDAAIFFDRITSDLQNTQRYSKIKFEGKSDRVAFATIIRVPVDARKSFSAGRYEDQLGKVEYYFDRVQGGLYVRQANYGQAVNDKFSPPRLLVSSIVELKLRYYFYDGHELLIRDEAKSGRIPIGIMIEANINQGIGQESLQRFIRIPIGS